MHCRSRDQHGDGEEGPSGNTLGLERAVIVELDVTPPKRETCNRTSEEGGIAPKAPPTAAEKCHGKVSCHRKWCDILNQEEYHMIPKRKPECPWATKRMMVNFSARTSSGSVR